MTEPEYDDVYVDVPNPNTVGEGDNEWVNVGNFTTKSQAVAWIRENLGPCDDDGRICLLTLGDPRNQTP